MDVKRGISRGPQRLPNRFLEIAKSTFGVPKIDPRGPGAAKSGPEANQERSEIAIYAFLTALGRILGRLRALWGPLGEVLGAFWEALGSISEAS